MQDLHDQIVACMPKLRRYARGLTGDKDAADDLVQDTLERAWARIGLWQRRGDLRAWLFSILHNVFIDRMRSARAIPEEPMRDETMVPVRDAQSDMLEVRDLGRALMRLPPEQREVLLLVGVEQMSYEDVAKTIAAPLGTVMSRLSRARERLNAILEGRETVRKLKAVK